MHIGNPELMCRPVPYWKETDERGEHSARKAISATRVLSEYGLTVVSSAL